jgi:hypothetical protein
MFQGGGHVSKKTKRTGRVALYARQDVPLHRSEGYRSLAGQLADLRGAAERLGYVVVAEYQDYGAVDSDLPGFRALLEAGGREEFDDVFVARLHGWTGCLSDEELLHHHLLPLLQAGLGAYVYEVPYWAIDAAQPDYLVYGWDLLLDWATGFLAAVAQERRRQRGALGITDAETPVYGYRLRPGAACATLAPEQAAVVQAIFAGSAAGQSCAEVAETLNAAGQHLLSGAPFTAQAVHALRRDSHYMLAVDQGEGVGERPEPLIPWEQWRAAQLGAPDGVKLS